MTKPYENLSDAEVRSLALCYETSLRGMLNGAHYKGWHTGFAAAEEEANTPNHTMLQNALSLQGVLGVLRTVLECRGSDGIVERAKEIMTELQIRRSEGVEARAEATRFESLYTAACCQLHTYESQVCKLETQLGEIQRLAAEV